MTLGPGRDLLHYRIVDKLGEGGMGIVWRAVDTSLDREAAIKVLPPAFATDTERLARFEREAKLLASLNHPNIAAIYGLHRDGETRFIAMERVEGENLAVRLARGAMPVDEALEIAAQVADGFAAAHDQGVVHRDLKPANLVSTAEGRVKILDFGLAKMFAPDGTSGPVDLSVSPTITSAGTVAGTLLGTAAYMSPEQARGKPVDRRADVWAFGCVLYELLTGRQAFSGETITDVLAAIVHTEPDWDRLPPETPAGVVRLLRRCLRKDARARVRDMGDLRVLLDDARSEVASGEVGSGASVPAPPSVRRGRLGWIVAGVLAAGLVVSLVAILGPFDRDASPAPAGPQRYVLATADLQPASAPALSPDGTYVVYSAREGISRRLYRRDLGSFRVSPIAGTEDGTAPFFSPDGAWIGFFTTDEIKRIPTTGDGIAQVVATVPRGNAGEWGEDGTIWFTVASGGPEGEAALMRVPAAGGRPETVATLDREAGESVSWLPELLPDGETVLISIPTGSGPQKIVAVAPDGSRETVVEGGFLARYVEPGYLLYRDYASQAVVAVPFDAARLRVTGTAVALTEEVDASYCFDVARDGKLVYVPLPGAGEGDEVVWVDREGAFAPASDVRAQWAQPRVSPDGRRVLLRKTGTNCELWMLDVDRGSLTRVVHGHDAHDPVWSPDGRRFAYRRADTGALILRAVTGMRETAAPDGIAPSGAPQSWSPHGNLLAYTVDGRTTRTDIWIMPADRSSPGEPFVATEFDEDTPAFSPDGRWVAYVSDEPGSREVFVRAYPDRGGAWQISVGGGRAPAWSADGRTLFYLSGDSMMSVAIETGSDLIADVPVPLFDTALGPGRERDYDVAPDGRFFAVYRPGGEAGRREIRMLLSWQEVLRQTAAATP